MHVAQPVDPRIRQVEKWNVFDLLTPPFTAPPGSRRGPASPFLTHTPGPVVPSFLRSRHGASSCGRIPSVLRTVLYRSVAYRSSLVPSTTVSTTVAVPAYIILPSCSPCLHVCPGCNHYYYLPQVPHITYFTLLPSTSAGLETSFFVLLLHYTWDQIRGLHRNSIHCWCQLGIAHSDRPSIYIQCLVPAALHPPHPPLRRT